MDQTLVDEIIKRVSQKLAEADSAAPDGAADGKPKLLILTQEHGTLCHQMLESPRLTERYAATCALMEGYQCDMAEFDTVLLFNLTNEVLAKIATGLCDTPYTRLASQALLLGKRVFVAKEEVELYRYASTAPAAYYAMLEGKLRLLTASGLSVVSAEGLEDAVLSESAPAAPKTCCAAKPAAAPAKEQKLSKRVVTERDVISLKENGVTRALIGEKTIVTDLARELARTRGIEIVRE